MDSLKKLSDIVEQNKDRLIEAVYKDFGIACKGGDLFLEIFPLQDEITACDEEPSQLDQKEDMFREPGFFLPSSAYYQFQPLGAVGIMGAWNYQVF